MTFKWKLSAGVSIALAFLISSGIFSFASLVRTATDRQWVTHTHLVMERIDQVQLGITTAEDSERGYVITGDASYLEPYTTGIATLRQNLREVRELTADNPVQQHALDSVEPTISSRVDILQRVINLRTNDGPVPAAHAVQAGSGREFMTRITAQLSQMGAEERRLLLIRNLEAERSSRNTRLAVLLGNLLALLTLGLAGTVIAQEMVRRRHAEEEISKLNLNLERRVAERTQELAEQAKDLARSNSELQQFAYVASHDLQEPLRMVASFTQLLSKRYKDKLDDDARTFIAYAVDGATRMQTLISDLLSYSRVGTQGRSLEILSCDLVLDRVLNNLKLLIEESGAVITRQPLPDVLADPQQLGQLFQNLIANAIKFRGETSPRVDVAVQRHGPDWKITVRDNGIGIAPEHAERIFVIFQRLHTRTEYPGTGIGLAVCKKIVERHGGRIWVEGSPSHGSAFHFTIPAVHAHQGQERTHHELPAAVSAD